HLDVLAAPEADLGAVVTALKALPWDVMVLSNLAPDATNATRLAAALTRRGCAIRREAQRSCPYLELPSSWEEYVASLSAARRQTLRRRSVICGAIMPWWSSTTARNASMKGGAAWSRCTNCGGPAPGPSVTPG